MLPRFIVVVIPFFLRMLCMPKWKQFDCVLGTSTTLGDCIKCMPRNIPVNSCTRLICAYKQWRFHGSTSTSCVPLSVKCWHKLHAIFFACNDTLFFVAFWILLIGLQCVLCVYVHRKGCCFFSVVILCYAYKTLHYLSSMK